MSKKITRRNFLNYSGTLAAFGVTGLSFNPSNFDTSRQTFAKIRIKNVDSNFEREPLFPYHFKGSVITEAWQTAAKLESESGFSAIGLGTQVILWSDAKVFAAHSVSGGNALMYAMSERALEMLKGNSFTAPLQLL